MGVWKALAECIGKSRQCLQVVQIDGTLLVNDATLAEILGSVLQARSSIEDLSPEAETVLELKWLSKQYAVASFASRS